MRDDERPSMILPTGVMRVLAPNPSPLTGPGTNTYLVASADPDDLRSGCVVIDPGPLIEAHLAAVVNEAAAHGGVHAILITHGHPDHVEGAARLRELAGAPVRAWSREGTPAVDMTLADGEVIAVGGRQLRAIHTPGHRFDHLCFLLEDAQALFAGDLVAGVGTVVIAPPEGDMSAYLASLRRLLALDLRLILPAHGPTISQPRALLEGYIQHREERERQVIVALTSEPQTINALVAVIYTDVDPRLHPIAAYSVQAHLLKLATEGRAVHADDLSPSSSPHKDEPVESLVALAEGTAGAAPIGDEQWRLAYNADLSADDR
ncbi:MAG: MBL fold metallo-hydrolase [Ktedonobacterales bacterium]